MINKWFLWPCIDGRLSPPSALGKKKFLRKGQTFRHENYYVSSILQLDFGGWESLQRVVLKPFPYEICRENSLNLSMTNVLDLKTTGTFFAIE